MSTRDPRRGGRPPLDPRAAVASADVHLRLPAKEFDEAVARAKRERESLQDLIRRGLRQLLNPPHL
jgi:hypothetical protein